MKKMYLFLLFLALILVSCAVERLSNVVSKGVDGIAVPKWDLDFDVPVGEVRAQLSKIEEVKNMLEGLKFTDNSEVEDGESALIHVKIDDMELNDELFKPDENVIKAIGSESVLTWPLPVAKFESPEIEETSIPVIKLDLDGDNVQDLMLSELKSNDGSLKIKVKMDFQDLSGQWREATEDDYFNEDGQPYIAIEDVENVDGDCYAIQVGTGKFSFKPGDYQDGYLVFETKDFLNDYNNPIQPLGAWLWDVTADKWECEEDGSHKLSTTEFEYRVSIPPEALKIRGKSFDIVENILFGEDKEEAKYSGRSRSVVSRSGSALTPAEIKEKIQSADGNIEVLESLLTDDGVTLEDVAAAYDGDLEQVLTDSDCKVTDIMTSEIIASDKNIETLGKEQDGFGLYELVQDTTLSDIEKAGNLKSLADFCKFHKQKAVKAIKLSFEVEVDLGEGFLITAEFIKDYEMSVDTGDSLPFSKLGSILESANLEAHVSHNFACELQIKEPKIADKVMDISGIREVGDGFYAIPEEPCNIKFGLEQMPSEDGGVAFTMLVPKDKEVDIALNPTEENDLWLEMKLGANGTLKVDADEIAGMMGGE